MKKKEGSNFPLAQWPLLFPRTIPRRINFPDANRFRPHAASRSPWRVPLGTTNVQLTEQNLGLATNYRSAESLRSNARQHTVTNMALMIMTGGMSRLKLPFGALQAAFLSSQRSDAALPGSRLFAKKLLEGSPWRSRIFFPSSSFNTTNEHRVEKISCSPKFGQARPGSRIESVSAGPVGICWIGEIIQTAGPNSAAPWVKIRYLTMLT